MLFNHKELLRLLLKKRMEICWNKRTMKVKRDETRKKRNWREKMKGNKTNR